MLQLSHFGSSQPFTWRNSHLVQLLTSGKQPAISDPLIVNAFRKVDRGKFLPEDQKQLAYHDRLVKIGYGQVGTNPSIIGRQLEVLKPQVGGSYLHLGTGTGYMATLLSYLAGKDGKVYSMERVQWLWDKAREFSQPFRQNLSLEILYRDADAGLPQKAPYNGIVYSFIPNDFPEHMLDQLAIGGKLIFPTPNHELHVISRENRYDYDEEKLPDFNAYAFGTYTGGLD